jgi:hypothetical protein
MPKRLNFQLHEAQVTLVGQAKRKDKRGKVRQQALSQHE